MSDLPDAIRHKGAAYVRAHGPAIKSLLVALEASVNLADRLDDKHLDSPTLQGDEELLRRYREYHDTLRVAAKAIQMLEDADAAQ